MIKKWMNPELKELDVRRTKVIEPTISSPRSIEPLYGWHCPCCLKKSEYIFNTESLARYDFSTNHLPICPKYDENTKSCIIS